MKCATSTLHRQLAAQPGLVLSRPKEPNFFSRDERYARGLAWYASHFARARPGDLCGESSTHYTKRPKYPRTVERMRHDLPEHTRFVYVIRHPLDRLVSQFIHEWSDHDVEAPLERAVRRHPRLVDYGRYAFQLRPYLETFGPQRVLVAFFERLVHDPEGELARVASFIGYRHQPRWEETIAPVNVSRERVRRSRWRAWGAGTPWFSAVRPRPSAWRDVAQTWQLLRARPVPDTEIAAALEQTFDEDLAELGRWLGCDLSCHGFREQALAYEPNPYRPFPGYR